jgi:hypothetical protein
MTDQAIFAERSIAEASKAFASNQRPTASIRKASSRAPTI